MEGGGGEGGNVRGGCFAQDPGAGMTYSLMYQSEGHVL